MDAYFSISNDLKRHQMRNITIKLCNKQMYAILSMARMSKLLLHQPGYIPITLARVPPSRYSSTMNLLGSNPEPRYLTMLPWLSRLSTLTSVSNSDDATNELILSALISFRITFFAFQSAVYIWQLELSIKCSMFSKSLQASVVLSSPWGYTPE